MLVMKNNPLSVWFFNRYLDWQREEGEPKSVKEWADLFGISRSYAAMIMNGERENIGIDVADRIAIYYPEIYEITGHEPKDPLLALIQNNWDHLDEPTKDEINRLIEPYTGGRPANDEPQTDPRSTPNLGTS